MTYDLQDLPSSVYHLDHYRIGTRRDYVWADWQRTPVVLS